MKPDLYFLDDGIPERIDVRPRKDRPLMSAEKVKEAAATNDWAIMPVCGDCMEAAGIEDGGWIIVDFTRKPRPPKYGEGGHIDACLCSVPWKGQAVTMAKAYLGRWGSIHNVGTQYIIGDKHTMNAGYFATEIYGVVFASYGRDGRLIWKEDLEKYPTQLPAAATIHGGNISDPIII